MATGTDLEIIHAQLSEIAGSDAERLPSPETDRDLLAVWLKSHIDGSPHTRRAYKRIGGRFLEALEAAGGNLVEAPLTTCKRRSRPCAYKRTARRPARRPSTPRSRSSWIACRSAAFLICPDELCFSQDVTSHRSLDVCLCRVPEFGELNVESIELVNIPVTTDGRLGRLLALPH